MTKNVNGAAAIVAAKPIGARVYWQGALRTAAARRHWPARCEDIAAGMLRLIVCLGVPDWARIEGRTRSRRCCAMRAGNRRTFSPCRRGDVCVAQPRSHPVCICLSASPTCQWQRHAVQRCGVPNEGAGDSTGGQEQRPCQPCLARCIIILDAPQRPCGQPAQSPPGARRWPVLPWLHSLYAASRRRRASLARAQQPASLKSFEHAGVCEQGPPPPPPPPRPHTSTTRQHGHTPSPPLPSSETRSRCL
jgi:hypothetical protein